MRPKGITPERIGRRVYLRGNTYQYKGALKDLGAKWDRDQRAWWVSTTRYRQHQKELEQIITQSENPRATPKQVDLLVYLQGQTGTRVDRRALEGLSMPEASQMIDRLKKSAPRKSKPKPSTSRRPSTSGASLKQINYAMSLIDRLGRWGWHDSDYGQGMDPPSRKDLESWTQRDVSDLISSLKEEF